MDLSLQLGKQINPAWHSRVILVVCLAVFGCRQKELEGREPPPRAVEQEDRCKQVADAPLDGLPGRVGEFCLDPNADVRRYGEGTASPLDGVCVELFNGECEIYKGYGLEGVKTTQYVATGKGRASVSVVASRFRHSSGAFGFFTRRILGDGLPSQVTVVPLKVTGRAALGPGVLYLWRGKQVLEMNYVSESETPAEIEQNSAPVLRSLSASTSQLMLGTTTPETGVAVLESMSEASFGVLVRADGLFDLSGSGPYATAYFEASSTSHDPAYRLVTAERRDEAAVRDLLQLVTRNVPSHKLKGTTSHRVRWTAEGQAPETWLLTTEGNLLLAVAPLTGADPPSQSTPESRKADAQAWDVFAARQLSRLKSAAQSALK
jgi:hypothetical protein